jgi:hypothetical protein
VDLLYPVTVGFVIALFALPGVAAGRIGGRLGWAALLWPACLLTVLRATSSGEFTFGGLELEFFVAFLVFSTAITGAAVAYGIRLKRRSPRRLPSEGPPRRAWL